MKWCFVREEKRMQEWVEFPPEMKEAVWQLERRFSLEQKIGEADAGGEHAGVRREVLS